MPAGDKSSKAESNAAQRTTFRPPWVKDGPSPLPTPTQSWQLKKAERRDSSTSDSSTESSSASSSNPLGVKLKKTTVQTKESQENGNKESTFIKPQLKPVPPKENTPGKKNKIPLPKLNSITDADRPNPIAGVKLRKTQTKTAETQENGTKEATFVKPQLKPVPQRETSPPKKDYKLKLPELKSVADRKLNDRKPSLTREPTKEDDLDKAIPTTRNALLRAESMRRMSQTPAPPPMPPPAPGMPPDFDKKPLNEKQKRKIEQLKSRPKARPDWSGLLKEIENKKKLNHVETNDRSQPLLPQAKEATDHYLYESEKQNAHNELLKEIAFGVKLKKVKTNDRSKPMLEGLRKFRRQMTIEEQIQKSISMASIPPDEAPVDEVDEMDDIDKVRDDLQSTKQMLALELRNKEAQIRENKILLARIQNLEAELEKARASGGSGSDSKASSAADEKIIKALKSEAEEARKATKDLEKKFNATAEELDNAKSQLDDAKRQNQLLEKKLQEALGGKRVSISKDGNLANGDDSEDDLIFSSESEESDGEDTEEKREKRAKRELKLLRNKLRNFKNKEDNAKKERMALREIIKRNQLAIKEEKKKFKQLQKEVDKMAALMKEVGSDEEEEDDEEEKTVEEEIEEEEEESSEEESESDSDDSEAEQSQSEDEEAPLDKKKINLEGRTKRHENILGALKKGNFMLKTNAEQLQDDLNKQKEATANLQRDLDSVLSELG